MHPLTDRLADQLAVTKKALLAMETSMAQLREVMEATQRVIVEAEAALADEAGAPADGK